MAWSLGDEPVQRDRRGTLRVLRDDKFKSDDEDHDRRRWFRHAVG